MNANAPPIGWLILSGLTEQAFLLTATVAMDRSLRSHKKFLCPCIRLISLGSENIFYPHAAGPTPARRVSPLPDSIYGRQIISVDRILDRAEIDGLAVANFLRPPGLFRELRIGSESGSLSIH